MSSSNDPEWGTRRNLQSCEHKSARAKECLQSIITHLPDDFNNLSAGSRQYFLYGIRHAINILDGTEEIAIQSANRFADKEKS